MGFCIAAKLPPGTTQDWSTLMHVYIGLGVRRDASGYSLAPSTVMPAAGIDLSRISSDSRQCLEQVIGNNTALRENLASVQTAVDFFRNAGNTDRNADRITSAEVNSSYGDKASDMAQVLNAYAGLAEFVTTEPPPPAPPPRRSYGIGTASVLSLGAAIAFGALIGFSVSWLRSRRQITRQSVEANARLDGAVLVGETITAKMTAHMTTMEALRTAIRELDTRMTGQGQVAANLLQALENAVEPGKGFADLIRAVEALRTSFEAGPTQVFSQSVTPPPELIAQLTAIEAAIKALSAPTLPPPVRFDRLRRVAGAFWRALARPEKVPPLKPEILAGDPDSDPAAFLGSHPPISVQMSRVGEIAAVVTPGISPVLDRRLQWDSKNEDRTLTVEGPDGKIYLLAIDGMGGQGNGDVAAQLVALAFQTEIPRSGDSEKAWELANAAVWRFNQTFPQIPDVNAGKKEALALISDPTMPGPTGQNIQRPAGACAVVVTAIPPEKKGEPVRMRYEWAGDARAKHFRRNRKTGRWEEIYSTFDQGYVHMWLRQGAIQPGNHFAFGGGGMTGVLAAHPNANSVNGGVGIKEQLVKWGMLQGAIRNSKNQKGFDDPPKELGEGVPTKAGDLILLGSDGFWENFFSTAEILWIINRCRTADEAVRELTRVAHLRMKILAEARAEIDRTRKKRVPFQYKEKLYIHKFTRDVSGKVVKFESVPCQQGTPLYLDNAGNVYTTETGGEPVNHFKSDNFSLAALVFKPPSRVFF